jgi:ABC-type lipoprotein release transport system permease subunit
MNQYDNTVVFVDYDVLKSFLEFENNTATLLEVTLKNLDNVGTISEQIDTLLGFPFISKTFYDINYQIFA